MARAVMAMEDEFVVWLQQQTSEHESLAVGIGDDGAVLRWGDEADLVIAADLLAEGIHFQLEQLGPHRVGRKALAVNLSDLAAMAAQPVAATISLLLPPPGSRPFGPRDTRRSVAPGRGV